MKVTTMKVANEPIPAEIVPQAAIKPEDREAKFSQCLHLSAFVPKGESRSFISVEIDITPMCRAARVGWRSNVNNCDGHCKAKAEDAIQKWGKHEAQSSGRVFDDRGHY
jgi:hypothetical protein